MFFAQVVRFPANASTSSGQSAPRAEKAAPAARAPGKDTFAEQSTDANLPKKRTQVDADSTCQNVLGVFHGLLTIQ